MGYDTASLARCTPSETRASSCDIIKITHARRPRLNSLAELRLAYPLRSHILVREVDSECRVAVVLLPEGVRRNALICLHLSEPAVVASSSAAFGVLQVLTMKSAHLERQHRFDVGFRGEGHLGLGAGRLLGVGRGGGDGGWVFLCHCCVPM